MWQINLVTVVYVKLADATDFYVPLYMTIGHDFYITYVESLTLTHRVPSKGWLIEPFLFTIFTKIPPYKNMQVSNIVCQIQYHFAKGEFL